MDEPNNELHGDLHLYDVPIIQAAGFCNFSTGPAYRDEIIQSLDGLTTSNKDNYVSNRKQKRKRKISEYLSVDPSCAIGKEDFSMSSHLDASSNGTLFNVPITQQIPTIPIVLESRTPTYRNRVLNDQRNLEVSDMGAPECECPYCGALFWRYEAVKASYRKNIPDFSRCCKKGLIKLSPLKNSPPYLSSLFDQNTTQSKNFKQNIRTYNATFAFTSMGGKIDYEINKKPDPPVFRLCGQNHHVIGSLLPLDNLKPKFSQLYVYDTANELQNRMSLFSENQSLNTINQDIVENLIKMFDDHNEIAKSYRMARDRFEENKMLPLKLKLVGRRSNDSRQYEYPTSSEIAGLLVGDFGVYDQDRDIIVQYKDGAYKWISYLHPSLMALQYPLLLPSGDDSYSTDIAYVKIDNRHTLNRKFVTMREYYAYRLQQRRLDNSALLRGGRLFQQFVVDVFTCVEQERLDFIRRNQKTLRSELYSGICDAFFRGDRDGDNIGKKIILPSTYTGSPRYMLEHYHDAMAICKFYGSPDFFLTFTCNPHWPEVYKMLDFIPGQKPEDRPDIVARVFKMKVESLMEDIKKREIFGKIDALLYTVEFQKRGLPHIHCLVWLKREVKPLSVHEIDFFICAELPCENTDPVGYEVVSKFMIHGPCGSINSNSPCMRNGRCSKFYPKKFNAETFIDSSGFAEYKRSDNGRCVKKNDIKIDNRFVVPHNRNLVVRYHAHLNMEFCCYSNVVKYLFKYIHKGSDRIRAIITETSNENNNKEIDNEKVTDEIKAYLDCRYISPCEASWRLFEFPIHHRNPSVERLVIHLPNMNVVLYDERRSLGSLVYGLDTQKTMLTEWMHANRTFDDARHLTYVEFPTNWVWDGKEKIWSRRKKGKSIGRISYIHPNSGELFYLRILLNIVKGPRSFEEIKTVEGITHDTFQSACNAYGLLGDDNEWIDALKESVLTASSSQLRHLFVVLLIFCDVADPGKLFDLFWKYFTDDILYKLNNKFSSRNISMSEYHLKSYVLTELEEILNRSGHSLSDYNMPMPDNICPKSIHNRLLNEELSYDINELRKRNAMVSTLNYEQKIIFDAVITSVENNKGEQFFVYGHGGTGKTYLYEAIITKIRSEQKIVLVVASSGIAALLLPGGRTAHSRFKIPLDINETSSCDIRKGTQLAELIKQTSLIVWDEAPMNHRYCFEAIDRSLRDILSTNEHDTVDLPFGGKTVLLGGDFRQILPVVPQGTKEDILNASITKSYLWPLFKIHKLQRNMRLEKNKSNFLFDGFSSFDDWLLALGDGRIKNVNIERADNDKDWIQIPECFVIKCGDNPIKAIIDHTYCDFSNNHGNLNYLKERAIVTPKNENVDKINKIILDSLIGENHSYYSFDSICRTAANYEELELLYPVDFLNSLKFNGFPHHAIDLKINTPIMLLRNLNPSIGLCNGTRLMVVQLGKKVIEAIIITGAFAGDRVFIPRITLSTTEKKWPFTLKRRQFPIKICYCMTINKSQGQTLKQVGLYLDEPVFTHGQLYVALSRVTSENGIRIAIENEGDEENTFPQLTKNIVYSEIFESLV